MIHVQRFIGNPFLLPEPDHDWESAAAFNGCPVQVGKNCFLLYRAQAKSAQVHGATVSLSTIGVASSTDRVTYQNRRQLITPIESWEKYGCEDPRVTHIEGKFVIFYTALSAFPPNVESIKVAVALSADLKTVNERHLVTPFNAKAMALFPEKINGKYAAVLTVHTDMPPAKICIALFDRLEQIWDPKYWENWYKDLNSHTLSLLRNEYDHLEVGAPPVKTESGWILVYSYIKNYQMSQRSFGIEIALLDNNNPLDIVGKTDAPIMLPERPYEINGQIANVIFPSGALLSNNYLGIYYGAADTSCCLATLKLDDILKDLLPKREQLFEREPIKAKRFSGNPIIKPIREHSWEDKYTLNPAAVNLNGKIHILYRAMGKYDTSVLGYASARDGLHIDERLSDPVYMPREEFERKLQPGYSGCEDPRLTRMGDKLYMCYTAYDGKNPTRVALTNIKIEDFCAKRWSWSRPQLISPPGHNDKNACLFPEKIRDKYVFFHRQQHAIWLDYVNSLEFGENKWLKGEIIFRAKPKTWYSEKVGIGPPPIKTPAGWLLIFHALSKEDLKYRLGAMLLDFEYPERILAQLPYPILEPVSAYENQGLRHGTVFACGAAEIGEQIYIYYGGADQFVAVASISRDELLHELGHAKINE